jgi:phage shock protein A
MGIFSRFKDIVSSNLNAMLDKAEDPEKLIRLMIQEMEETLVELKSSCAGVMADKKKVERDRDALKEEEVKWQQRAELAVDKNKEDLAKEALVERNRFRTRIKNLDTEIKELDKLIEQARKDIEQLEGKLNTAREKQQVLVQRRIRAGQSLKTQKEIRKAGSMDAIRKFQEFEHRIDRMEAEAGLVNVEPEKGSLEDEFNRLENEDSINAELKKLKKAAKKE